MHKKYFGWEKTFYFMVVCIILLYLQVDRRRERESHSILLNKNILIFYVFFFLTKKIQPILGNRVQKWCCVYLQWKDIQMDRVSYLRTGMSVPNWAIIKIT